MTRIIDAVSFNGEFDLLEIRLHILNEYVDRFIIVEATTTFSGKEKPLYYEKEKARYKKWEDKITYHVVKPEDEERYMALANGSPNTRGASHWKKEFCQKECIKDALVGLQDDDIVFIGDCDEVWEDRFEPDEDGVYKLPLRVYTYYLNNLSTEQFWGTICTRYRNIKNNCLNHLRSTDHYKCSGNWGWHFTSLKDSLRRKLTDSYTEDSYASPQVMRDLESNVANDRDFLGRAFRYSIDESEWPKYLKNNKERYKNLCKQPA
jgi:beta-1,4-mannosyl-glycoprotein beta-1,4-N-acetylglucosaminyltransferase